MGFQVKLPKERRRPGTQIQMRSAQLTTKPTVPPIPHTFPPPLHPCSEIPVLKPSSSVPTTSIQLTAETWRNFWVPPSPAPLPIGGQRVLVKTHQASPTAFMGFLPLFLGMYSSSGERDSGSSLHSGELWLCSARVLFWEALLAVAPERIPVDRKKEGQ